MSSIRVELTGDNQALLDRLRELEEADIAGAMAAVGEAIRTSTLERFDAGKDPEERAWKTSIRAQQDGGKTLMVSRDLANSIHVESSSKGVEVGTNKEYAAIHQFGGTIRAKGDGPLKFKIGDQWISKKSIKMPARPYLGINDEDMREITHIIEDAVTGD